MPADRESPSLADYAATAIGPVLIMLMVGSLVFFLVEVLYAGQYSERLLYTLFFFVAGAVLVARIAIQVDATRATAYGLGLAAVTYLAMFTYVEYPAGTPLRSIGWLVNLGLMSLIWWSAHKLTWDCTHVDDNRDASGRGLLAAAGLTGQEDPLSRDAESAERSAAETEPQAKKKKKRKRPSPFSVWVGRWREYREKRRTQPHTPGVWVIYIALAALPLFAVGQSLIPADDADRRRATFLQMVVYVGSALGLLVTTSLLGLRRYLDQRKAKLPTALTIRWLGLGGVLIVAFLAVGAFLPRPHSEVPWFGLPKAGKEDREASQYAQLKDTSGKGEGSAGNAGEKGEGSASGKNGEPGGSKGEKGSGGGKDGKGPDSRSRDAKRSEGDKSEKSESGRSGDTDREGKDAQGRSGDRSSGSSTPKIGGALEKVAQFLKWVVIAIVVFVVLAVIVLAVLRYLAPFTEWARNFLDALRNWWAGLFSGKASPARTAAAEAMALGPQRPPPFAEYSNPFDDGSADRREPPELVEYTFAALDAWAWDRGHGHQPADTPLEFAARLGEEFPDFRDDLRRLAGHYARVAYSELPLPADVVKLLERVWDQMVHGVTAAEAVGVDADQSQ